MNNDYNGRWDVKQVIQIHKENGPNFEMGCVESEGPRMLHVLEDAGSIKLIGYVEKTLTLVLRKVLGSH